MCRHCLHTLSRACVEAKCMMQALCRRQESSSLLHCHPERRGRKTWATMRACASRPSSRKGHMTSKSCTKPYKTSAHKAAAQAQAHAQNQHRAHCTGAQKRAHLEKDHGTRCCRSCPEELPQPLFSLSRASCIYLLSADGKEGSSKLFRHRLPTPP